MMGNKSGRVSYEDIVNMNKITKGLYLGGFLGIHEKKILKKKKITHILAIHDEAEAKWPDEFTYKCLRVTDFSNSDLTSHFADCISFIHSSRLEGGVVYVHCAAGMSRSVTITVAYLMTISTLSFHDALKVVQYCREMANPNAGFRAQLENYQDNQLPAERERLLTQFPSTSSLQDEESLQLLLKKVHDSKKEVERL